jgi:hypothetical protein
MLKQAAWWGSVSVAAACIALSGARADVTSDQAAAILVFPKLVVDTSVPPETARGPVDTLIRVSNTSDRPITMWCFYVNATPHCTNGTGSCLSTPVTCSPIGACKAEWQESDFVVSITARQPIAWLASQGAVLCQENDNPAVPCLPLSASGRPGPKGQNNDGSRISPVPEDPFIGELKCIAVDQNNVPVERNDLKGEAEIIRSTATSIDVEGYNAVGVPAILGLNAIWNGDNTLVLGGSCNGGANSGLPCSNASSCPGGTCAAEYSSCPNILILDHFFDGALDPISQRQVTTDLTLVPCSEDFATQVPLTTTVQFLVFNEFEQRLSTSRPVTCFQEFHISDIDKASKDRSIFSAAVQGTLTGQTRIRGVADQDQAHGHALLGVAEEFRADAGSAAVNLHFQGIRPQSDFIHLPAGGL